MLSVNFNKKILAEEKFYDSEVGTSIIKSNRNCKYLSNCDGSFSPLSLKIYIVVGGGRAGRSL